MRGGPGLLPRVQAPPTPPAVRLWKTFRSKPNTIPDSGQKVFTFPTGMLFTFRTESRSPSTGFPHQSRDSRLYWLKEAATHWGLLLSNTWIVLTRRSSRGTFDRPDLWQRSSTRPTARALRFQQLQSSRGFGAKHP